MKQKVFAVYDSKVECYLNPFLMQTKGQAIRSWTDTVVDPKSSFHRHPGDYTLFELGEFDPATGIVTMHKAHINLGTAAEVMPADLEGSVQRIRSVEG